MFTTIFLLAAAATQPQVTPEENRLISESIADLRHKLADPGAAQFRRVHLFRARGQDGVTRTLLCGQVFIDDPRSVQPDTWTMFGAAELSTGFFQIVGPMATRWCDQPSAEWDYDRDFAARYAGEIGRR